MLAQADRDGADGLLRAATQQRQIGLGQQRALAMGFAGQAPHAGHPALACGVAGADGLQVLASDQGQAHRQQLGPRDRLAVGRPLAGGRGRVDQLTRLQVARADDVAADELAQVGHDRLDHHRALVVAVLVQELVAQQRGQVAAGKPPVVPFGMACRLHRNPPFFGLL
jgi:hypothetical protein